MLWISRLKEAGSRLDKGHWSAHGVSLKLSLASALLGAANELCLSLQLKAAPKCSTVRTYFENEAPTIGNVRAANDVRALAKRDPLPPGAEHTIKFCGS